MSYLHYLRGSVTVIMARGALSGIAIFSAFINILMLTGPLYMLQHSPLTTFQRCGSSFQAMRQELFSIFPGLLFISP